MSSWVQLLALLAAFLRCGAAEGDPLPVALVELVRSSAISSVEDLHMLLLSDSVDDDQDGSLGDGGLSNVSKRLPRSLDAQPAQQAQCKTRTEVMEVTRAMLDRSNANFLLWPPCVEVQRCSGCCNTKTLQCVPVLTHTRYLQVMKIEYVNKRPSYTKAVVPVQDHTDCQCHPAPRGPSAPKKKPSSRRQQTNAKDLLFQQHYRANQTQGVEAAKPWPKDELHRRDELKDNQRVQLEELLEQHPWGPRGDTFTQAQEGEGGPDGYTLAGEDAASLSGETGSPHWVRNASRLLGTADSPEPRGGGGTEERRGGRRGGGGGFNDSETVSSNRTAVVGFDLAMRYKGSGRGGGGGGGGVRGGRRLSNSTGSEEARQGGRSNSEEKEEGQDKKYSLTYSSAPLPDRPKIQKNQWTTTESAYQTPESRSSPTASTNQRRENRLRPTEVTNQGTEGPRRQEAEGDKSTRDNQTPEEETRIGKAERERMEEEKTELLLLHKRLDEEKERLRQQQALKQREEEEEQKEEEERRRYQSQLTTQTTATAPATSTRAPTAPAAPRPPARPHPPRKRTRKNRKRISKAAMRAMLM